MPTDRRIQAQSAYVTLQRYPFATSAQWARLTPALATRWELQEVRPIVRELARQNGTHLQWFVSQGIGDGRAVWVVNNDAVIAALNLMNLLKQQATRAINLEAEYAVDLVAAMQTPEAAFLAATVRQAATQATTTRAAIDMIEVWLEQQAEQAHASWVSGAAPTRRRLMRASNGTP
jgi:hypothetical protein